MINLWYKTYEGYDRWQVEIFANSDLIEVLYGYASEEEAQNIGEAYIRGFKFARDEL